MSFPPKARGPESVARRPGAARERSFAIIPGRGHACVGPAEREDGVEFHRSLVADALCAPIACYSRHESATLSARLTVVRSRSESLTMKKQPQDSTLVSPRH